MTATSSCQKPAFVSGSDELDTPAEVGSCKQAVPAAHMGHRQGQAEHSRAAGRELPEAYTLLAARIILFSAQDSWTDHLLTVAC